MWNFTLKLTYGQFGSSVSTEASSGQLNASG